MSGGDINATEMVASLINQKSSLIEGIRYAQDVIEGSMTMLVMTPEGIYAARDRLGRTPLILGKKEDAICASFENFAYFNLGYHDYKELGPSEIVFFTPDGVETVSPAKNEMKICSFLWVYYGYPTSSYEGINVEQMRYNCGDICGYCCRCSGVRYCTCHRLCQPFRYSLCPPIYQIYPDLAAFFYAGTSASERADCSHETDPGS